MGFIGLAKYRLGSVHGTQCALPTDTVMVSTQTQVPKQLLGTNI